MSSYTDRSFTLDHPSTGWRFTFITCYNEAQCLLVGWALDGSWCSLDSDTCTMPFGIEIILLALTDLFFCRWFLSFFICDFVFLPFLPTKLFVVIDVRTGNCWKTNPQIMFYIFQVKSLQTFNSSQSGKSLREKISMTGQDRPWSY